MNQAKILWADDEIDLLKPHVLFLEKKGFQLTTVSSGFDAIQSIENEAFDIVFLDENMPGMTGLETLTEIKKRTPLTPVVMITKSEEEHIMEQAIGSQIADYLIKPVNPNQILLSCKKLLEGKALVSQKTNESYQQDFQKIVMALFEDLDTNAWVDLYKKLINWEIKMDTV
jgi:DNA-binding NtrC family response regulator